MALMQGFGGIDYASYKIKDHEIKYATHDLELVATIMALMLWMFLSYRMCIRTQVNLFEI